MSEGLAAGYAFPAFEVEVEKFPLRLFAKAVGEVRPIYHDEVAARQAGYASIVAMPTYLFSLSLPPNDPFDVFRIIGIDLASSLHGEQAFEFHKPVCAGDVVKVARTLSETYEKKNGALKFNVVTAEMTNAKSGALLCITRQTIVTRVAGAAQ